MQEEGMARAVLAKINELFKKFIKVRDDNQMLFERESLGKVLYFINTNYSAICNDFTTILSPEEIKLVSTQLSWILNKLLLIALHDNDYIFMYQTREIIGKLMPKGLFVSSEWFHKLAQLQVELLAQSLDPALPLEIILPDQDEESELPFSRAVVTSLAQFKNLKPFCLFNLVNAIELNPSLIDSLSSDIAELVLQVFNHSDFQCQTYCIFFLTSFYKGSHSQKLMCNAFEIIASIANSYRTREASEKALEDEFGMAVVKFTNFLTNQIKLSGLDVPHRIYIEKLIASTTRLVYFELKFKEHHTLPSNVSLFIELIGVIFSEIDFDRKYAENLKSVEHLASSYGKLLLLAQYEIVLELEEARDFTQKVSAISPTWKRIQLMLMEKINALDSGDIEEAEDSIVWIRSALQLAHDVDFHFTRRHQLMHAGIELCVFCDSADFAAPACDNPLMKFAAWKYQHISLDFFDDLPALAHQIIQRVKSRSWMSASTSKLMSIFTSILAPLPTLSDEDKLFMLTMITLPFCKSFKQCDKMSKSAEFKKIQASMTYGMKVLVSTLSADDEFRLKCNSIRLIAQLRLNRISTSSMWLRSSLMRLIFTREDQRIQRVLLENLKHLLVTNIDTMSGYLSLYQTLRLDQDSSIEWIELKSVLCLHDGDAVILRTRAGAYKVFCDKCPNNSEVHFPRTSDRREEIQRRLAYASKFKSVLVSIDQLDGKERMVVNSSIVESKSDAFCASFIQNIPACVAHSKEFAGILDEGGAKLFRTILREDEEVLKHTSFNIECIIASIQLDARQTPEFYENFLEELLKLSVKYSQLADRDEIQLYLVNIIGALGSSARINDCESDVISPIEWFTLRCLKLLTYFMILRESQVKSSAVNTALRMLQKRGYTLPTFVDWFKTSYLSHVARLCLTASLDNRSFIQTLYDFLRMTHIYESLAFIRSNLPVILATILPFCAEKNQLSHVQILLDTCRITFAGAIRESSLVLHECCYAMDAARRARMERFITKNMEKSFREVFQMDRSAILERVCAQYCNNQAYVLEVVRELGDETIDLSDVDKIAEYIATKFLAILNYFENTLKSKLAEKPLKQAIVQSLGELVRFLGQRISNLYFRVMSLLKEATKMDDINAKAVAIDVWRILVLHSNASVLGPFLGVIFVSLEEYLDDYPDKVQSICLQLINNNASLLGRHFPDLFFIAKTRHSGAVKRAVLSQIESQRLSDRNDFLFNLELLLKHLRNENTDSGVKYYYLLHLEDLIKSNRGEFNDLISNAHPSVGKLVCILTNGSKSAYSGRLKLQIAKCFGELGAIRPVQQKENHHASTILTVHCDAFAKEVLTIMCKYYKDIVDVRNAQSLSLAVQSVFRERAVDTRHEIWNFLTEESRTLFHPLFSSRYTPTVHQPEGLDDETIFWNHAQTETEWAFLLSVTITQRIDVVVTRNYLRDLIPSMRDNQEIALFLFPKIVLEYFKNSSAGDFDEVLLQEFALIFKLIMTRGTFAEFSKEELKFTYVAYFDFEPTQKLLENSLDKIQATLVKVAKMVFEMWDVLERFVESGGTKDRAVSRIKHVQAQFSLLSMAEVTFRCGEYERAMVFLERHILQLKDREREDALSFLIKIYAKLREPDLVDGVRWLRKTDWSLSDKIFINEVTGNLEEVPACIEMMMREPSLTQEEIENIASCYIQANQLEESLECLHVQLEKLYRNNAEQTYCDDIMAEPLWRLAKWDRLEDLIGDQRLQVNDKSSWNVTCSRLMLKFRRFDGEGFHEELDRARASVMDNFKAFDVDHAMYNGNYANVVHLHTLTEFEKIHEALAGICANKTVENAGKTLKGLISELDTRRALLQPSLSVIESTLAVRRALLSIVKTKLQILFNKPNESQFVAREIDREIGKTWTRASKIACKQKLFTQANAFLLEAEPYKPYDLLIEKPKYLWKKGEHLNALQMLELSCKQLTKACSRKKTPEMMKLLSRVQLNIARNHAEIKYVDFDANKELFKRAIFKGAENEKCYLQLADYLDRHHFSVCESNQAKKDEICLPEYDKLFEIMQAYGSSMQYGSVHVLQSMSRFLQIWLDASSLCEQTNSKYKTRPNVSIVLEMHTYVRDTLDRIPVDYFYTAYSQLISRLCHPSQSVFKIVKRIVGQLIEKHPLKSMWFIAPGLKSKSPFRKQRASEIFEPLSHDTGIRNFVTFIDRIMSFTQSKAPADRQFMAKMHPEINRLLLSSNILMPLQQNLHLTQNTTLDGHSSVHIQSLEVQFEVMQSLQKPKKITFIGDDGNRYAMLLKFKDDLRVDFRFLEFVKVVNDFYRKDSDASQRCLVARTYSVIPLNEELGIIEWVPNLNTFKNIVHQQYKQANIRAPISSRELNGLHEVHNATPDKIASFNALKEKFPPVLGQWFLQQFPSPQCYFRARQNYIKSVAIMSMVGYVMGLGDRHLENMLFDTFSGEVVHVDFNCLFHRGEKLTVPERVPFRLTHSMVEAMGILGIEGPYRKCCEITLRIMQNEKNTLMSYLRPFIYDPMISKNEKEVFDANAMHNLKCIENKLKGIVRSYKKTSEVPLSIEGNVNLMIKEATSDENLALMYFHWNPFI